MTIQVESRHAVIVLRVLRPILDQCYVFGSRSNGKARKFSDLDIVIKGRVSPEMLRGYRSQFEDSDLPFKVDLCLWNDLDNTFQDLVSPQLISLSNLENI